MAIVDTIFAIKYLDSFFGIKGYQEISFLRFIYRGAYRLSQIQKNKSPRQILWSGLYLENLIDQGRTLSVCREL